MSKSVSYTLSDLIKIMKKLRDPENGCPWDVEQTFETILPYTLEEAYEVAEAIDQGDMAELKTELGDLLFQVIFHSQMAEEQKAFTINDVIHEISEKMVVRHPHVFGNKHIKDAEAQTIAWEEQKTRERQAKADKLGRKPSILDDVPSALPALLRASKLQKRAAKVGFDWPEISQVVDKMQEELGELSEAIAAKQGQDKQAHIEEELGDMLFVCANLARHLDINPEEALRKANQKFIRRFQYIENSCHAQKRSMDECTLEEMEELWIEAKTLEKQ